MTVRTPVISLGAGVQSSALLLMAVHGELEGLGEQPELAVFADTQREPPGVYEWLAFLRMAAYRAGIEVATTTAGDLLEASTAGDFNPIPLYRRNEDRSVSLGQRQCTSQFKIRPYRTLLRDRGFGPDRPVETWIGITTDEIERVKPADVKWASNRHPFIELEMSRRDCGQWLIDHDYPLPPKSACYFCPFSSGRRYADMRDSDPETWEKACAADEAMRTTRDGREQFVLKTMEPLRTADLIPADHGQLDLGVDAECDGVCFV